MAKVEFINVIVWVDGVRGRDRRVKRHHESIGRLNIGEPIELTQDLALKATQWVRENLKRWSPKVHVQFKYEYEDIEGGTKGFLMFDPRNRDFTIEVPCE